MITVHVKLYATLRDGYPDLAVGESMPVQMEPGDTLKRLIEILELPANLVKIIFVNNRITPEDAVLSDDDRVGIFPPVGGG